MWQLGTKRQAYLHAGRLCSFALAVASRLTIFLMFPRVQAASSSPLLHLTVGALIARVSSVSRHLAAPVIVFLGGWLILGKSTSHDPLTNTHRAQPPASSDSQWMGSSSIDPGADFERSQSLSYAVLARPIRFWSLRITASLGSRPSDPQRQPLWVGKLVWIVWI